MNPKVALLMGSDSDFAPALAPRDALLDARWSLRTLSSRGPVG